MAVRSPQVADQGLKGINSLTKYEIGIDFANPAGGAACSVNNFVISYLM